MVINPGMLMNKSCPSDRLGAGNVRDVTTDRGDITGRAAAGLGWLVSSIRKNLVLPGSGPTDLNYWKNVYVLS